MIQIPVEKTEKIQRVPKEITTKLKEMGILNRVKFMKKELVFCPMRNAKISPMYCIQCPFFLRRVKGVVYCRYDEKKI